MDSESNLLPESSTSSSSSSSGFDRDRHVTFLEMMYELLPSQYQTQEINHLTLAYFVISGLDLLGAMDRVDKDIIASWVLSFQALPTKKAEKTNGEFYGFCGSRSSQFPLGEDGDLIHNGSHLASTYCGFAILKVVGYDFSKIDSESITISMRNLQQSDGSFVPIHIGAEADLRFVYCAAAICNMLENWSGMDRQKAKTYILNCQSYDGGFGLTPGSESHGGGTYCAIASLRLMGFIEDDILSRDNPSSIINIPLLLEWCLQKQAEDGGFQGRPNKPADTCYAFWPAYVHLDYSYGTYRLTLQHLDVKETRRKLIPKIGSTLKILGGLDFINKKALKRFLLTCQSKYGGFSKFPRDFPDIYHSYYGFTAFSLLEEPDLNPLFVELGITDASAWNI